MFGEMKEKTAFFADKEDLQHSPPSLPLSLPLASFFVLDEDNNDYSSLTFPTPPSPPPPLPPSAPFFVLDEVDAALDNVNVRKVCHYIK